MDASLVVVETVMSFPLETVFPPVVHVAVGGLTKPPILVTVQVKLYIIPALAVPDLLTLVVMTSGGTIAVSEKYTYDAFQQTLLNLPTTFTVKFCIAGVSPSLVTLHT